MKKRFPLFYFDTLSLVEKRILCFLAQGPKTMDQILTQCRVTLPRFRRAAICIKGKTGIRSLRDWQACRDCADLKTRIPAPAPYQPCPRPSPQYVATPRKRNPITSSTLKDDLEVARLYVGGQSIAYLTTSQGFGPNQSYLIWGQIFRAAKQLGIGPRQRSDPNFIPEIREKLRILDED